MRAVLAHAGLAVLLAATLAACTSDDDGDGLPVGDAAVGDCLRAPAEILTEIENLTRVGCDTAHEQEVFALVTVTDATGAEVDAFPGDAALKSFADGACAERFEAYVGVDYRDSALFFTYLLPNARGWQSGDRTVMCAVTTTGETLTASVRGTGV